MLETIAHRWPATGLVQLVPTHASGRFQGREHEQALPPIARIASEMRLRCSLNSGSWEGEHLKEGAVGVRSELRSTQEG